MRGDGAWIMTLVVTLPLAACNQGKHAEDPMQGCAKAGLHDLVSSSSTTVGEARSQREGPGGRPYAHVFPDLPESHMAYWCWTRADGTAYVSHLVADGEAVQTGTVDQSSGVPSGPPQFP